MANNKIKGITIEIGGDATKLGKALEETEKKSKDLQKELKGVNTLLKYDPKNITLLKQKQDLLNKSISECREKLSVLKDAQIQVQEQFEKGDITEEQYRNFQREIVATEQKLKSLKEESKSFGNVATQYIAQAGKSIENFGNKVSDVGKNFSVISAASSAILIGATKTAIDFESAWTGVLKTVDGTDEELEKIREGIFDLSEVTASSATDIASVAEAAGQLGIETDSILAFSETMVRLGDSTNVSADVAATSIAQLYNIMNSNINTVDRFGAAIVALGNNSATTEADILNMATRIAAAGSQIGLTEQDILALSASLASVGLEAEGGGSAISTVMTKIDKDVALNTETLATWAEVSNMSVQEFKRLWETDAISAIQKVISGMGDASKSGENLNVILDELGITSIRETDSMKRLSNASELMNDMLEVSNSAWQENNALTEESSKRYETAESKIQQIKNIISEICTNFLNLFLPTIKNIFDNVANFLKKLTELNPAVQKIVVVTLLLTSVLGPLIIFIGKLVSSIGSIMQIAPQLLNIFNGIKTAISGLFSILAANPIILVVAAIATLIAIFVSLWNNCESFRNFWISLWENLKTKFSQFADSVKNVIENIKNGFLNFASNINNNVIQPIWNKIQEFLNKIVSIAEWININVIQPILSIVVPIIQKITEICAKIWEIITVLLGVLVQWIYTNFILPIINRISNMITNIIQFFQNLWNRIVSIFSFIGSWFSERFNLAKDAIVVAFSPIVQWFSDRLNDIKNIFSSIGQFFAEKFQEAYNNVVSIFSGISSFFNGIFDSIKTIFNDIGTKIGNGIGEAFKKTVNAVINFAENTINKFIRAINSAISVINNIPGVNISKLTELNIPKLKIGMPYVPYDNYLALLHKGERVLTAEENRNYNENNSTVKNITNNEGDFIVKVDKFINNGGNDIKNIAEEMAFYEKQYKMSKGEI